MSCRSLFILAAASGLFSSFAWAEGADPAGVDVSTIAASGNASTASASVEAPAAPASAEVSTAPVSGNAPNVMAATSGLNEMRGKLQSLSHDPKTIRITVDGGYNVEFSYDSKTAMINGGSPITSDDLNYGDDLIIRYSGKELKAIVVDRASKAPKPQ